MIFQLHMKTNKISGKLIQNPMLLNFDNSFLFPTLYFFSIFLQFNLPNTCDGSTNPDSAIVRGVKFWTARGII